MPTPSEHTRDLMVALRRCLPVRKAAPGALEHLAETLMRVPVRSLAAVDELLRSSSFGSTEGWYELAAADLGRVAAKPHAWAFLALAASHRIGFVRQAALRELALAADGRAVPFVVLRLNDWVTEVRRAAQAALASYVSPAFAPSLVSALPLIFALEGRRRADHSTVVAWIVRLLGSAECQETLMAGCHSHDRNLKRLCLRIALDSGTADAGSVAEQAARDDDPSVRLWAVRQAGAKLQESWASGIARRALGDRSVQVRRVALHLLADALPEEEALRLLEEALVDENTSARWQARILRIARGPVDLAGFYRSALSTAATASVVRGALLGLGESGTRGDVVLVKLYLEAERPSVRRAALRALADLEPISTIGPFLGALIDPLPGISKEGRRALEPRLAYVPVGVLTAMISSEDAPSHTRRHALSLASHLSKWDALPLLLEGCGSADGEVAGRARMLLGGWCSRYNRTFPTPTISQVEKIESLWARVGKFAQPREELDQIIRLARRLATP